MCVSVVTVGKTIIRCANMCVPVMYVCWKAACVYKEVALPCVRPLLCSVSEAC